MMNKAFMLFCLMAVPAFISCDKKPDDHPVGHWDDNIRFSTTKVNFSRAGGRETITSEGNWWWIDGVSIDRKYFFASDEAEGIFIGRGESEYGPFGIPSSEIEYDEGANNFIILIESEWFRIVKENARKLVVEIQENDSGATRKLTLSIQCGNYFTGIAITQQ